MGLRKYQPGCPCCGIATCDDTPLNDSSEWTIDSGTWGSSRPSGGTTSTDALIIASHTQDAGNATWQRFHIATNVSSGDKAQFGISDDGGDNRVYVEFTHNISNPAINGGLYYDDDYGKFYFWISAITSQIDSGSTITYSVYRVTSGGSPTLVSGPTVLASTATGGIPSYMINGDDSTTTHTTMPRLMFGTGDTAASTVSYTYSGSENLCDCDSDIYQRKPRKYTAVVSGIATDTRICTLFIGSVPLYVPVGEVNGTFTLRNYNMLGVFLWPVYSCGHQEWGLADPYSAQSAYAVEFWSYWDGADTVLKGDVVITGPTGFGCAHSQFSVRVNFGKTVSGHIDVRALSGESLPLIDYDCTFGTASKDCGWLDLSGASFEISAVT